MSGLCVLGVEGGVELVEVLTEDVLGNVEGDVGAMVVGQEKLLADGADAEDTTDVDNVLATHAHHVGGVGIELGHEGLDAGKPLGHHEVTAGGVVDVGIVIVGLHIEHAGQVDDEKLIVGLEA